MFAYWKVESVGWTFEKVKLETETVSTDGGNRNQRDEDSAKAREKGEDRVHYSVLIRKIVSCFPYCHAAF